MTRRLESFSRVGRHPEHIPEITDPYRQILELEFHPVYQGPHTFLGYENPKPPRREWKVIPITTPDHFLDGLGHLIRDIQSKNTESSTLEPSPFDSLVGTRFYLKDQKAYQKALNKIYHQYSGIHRRILMKFTDEEKKRLKEILAEAKGYQPTDSVSKDPNWSPGINHHTGLPYNVHVDLDTGRIEQNDDDQ